MKPTLRHLVLATATVAALTTAGLSLAGPHMKDHGCQGMGARHTHNDSPRFERMQQRMAQRQAELKEALQLTPAQESAWNAYTTAIKPQTPPRIQAASEDGLTAPQRMERHLTLMQERQAQMTQRLQAMRQLYDTLSPEQRQTFDRFHQSHGRHRPTNG